MGLSFAQPRVHSKPHGAGGCGRKRAALSRARDTRSLLLWLVCATVPCWPALSRAAAVGPGSAEKVETVEAGQSAAGPAAAERGPTADEEPWEVGVGATGGRGDAGFVGTLLVGADAWYRWSRYLAAGLEGQTFVVDNGADGHNCGGCPDGGTFFTAFVEGRVAADSPVSLFGRLGVGPGWLRRWAPEGGRLESRLQPVFHGALGPQLTVGPVFVRLRGTLTASDVASFVGYGVELGAVL